MDLLWCQIQHQTHSLFWSARQKQVGRTTGMIVEDTRIRDQTSSVWSSRAWSSSKPLTIKLIINIIRPRIGNMCGSIASHAWYAWNKDTVWQKLQLENAPASSQFVMVVCRAKQSKSQKEVAAALPFFSTIDEVKMILPHALVRSSACRHTYSRRMSLWCLRHAGGQKYPQMLKGLLRNTSHWPYQLLTFKQRHPNGNAGICHHLKQKAP